MTSLNVQESLFGKLPIHWTKLKNLTHPVCIARSLSQSATRKKSELPTENFHLFTSRVFRFNQVTYLRKYSLRFLYLFFAWLVFNDRSFWKRYRVSFCWSPTRARNGDESAEEETSTTIRRNKTSEIKRVDVGVQGITRKVVTLLRCCAIKTSASPPLSDRDWSH